MDDHLALVKCHQAFLPWFFLEHVYPLDQRHWQGLDPHLVLDEVLCEQDIQVGVDFTFLDIEESSHCGTDTFNRVVWQGLSISWNVFGLARVAPSDRDVVAPPQVRNHFEQRFLISSHFESSLS